MIAAFQFLIGKVKTTSFVLSGSYEASFQFLIGKSRLQKVNFFVRGQANVRCDGCNYLKLLVVRLSPLAVNCEFRLFAGDSGKVKTPVQQNLPV